MTDMIDWTHPICTECWDKRNPNRKPIRVADEFTEVEICCFCGNLTREGIYVRTDPSEPKYCHHKQDKH